MPKTPSTKLFHLVKSLTGAEKRYFKIFINSKDAATNKYVQLFDAIEAQAEFDDEALRQAIYGDEPVETRKYSELKSYLYDLILKSLMAYDEKSSVDYRLKNMLLGVRTLFKRSHFEDCKELLYKAKKVALEYEDFKTLIEILDWEKKIAHSQTAITYLDKELENITQEEAYFLTAIKTITDYQNIFFSIYVSLRKGVSRDEKQISELKALMDNPLMAHKEHAKSFKAQVLYYRIYSLYYFSISDLHSFYESSKILLSLIGSNPMLLKEDVSEYISALNNHIISCGSLEYLDEVRETLDILIEVKPITKDDEVKIHRQYYSNKFRLCITTGEFEEGRKELNRHLKSIEYFGREQFQRSDYYFQYFCIYFGCGDYTKALDSLNEWLAMAGNSDRLDLQSFARILNLIIHYELGNTVLIESLIRSAYRYFKKGEMFFEMEKVFIQFFKEEGKLMSKSEKKTAFIALKSQFEKLSHLPIYKKYSLFDINAWIESKITGEPFAEVVRKKKSLPATKVA
ncbi:MAG: hypothetical protein R2830_25175 [Saprospiraceae bacterium]